MKIGQQRYRDKAQRTENDGAGDIKGRGGHDDRRDEQQCKGILYAARQIEKHCQLYDVIGQKAGRFARGQPLRCREGDRKQKIERGAGGDRRDAEEHRQFEIENAAR